MTERRILAILAASGTSAATWAAAVAVIVPQVSNPLPTIAALVGATGAALTAWVGAYRVAMIERQPAPPVDGEVS